MVLITKKDQNYAKKQSTTFKHLAHWGIDITSSEKTEKSMAEMELDINKSVGAEYAAIVESSATLKV